MSHYKRLRPKPSARACSCGNKGCKRDGSDAHYLAEKTGLWHQVERHADGVECVWCGNDGPCGELTEAGLAALAASGGRS